MTDVKVPGIRSMDTEMTAGVRSESVAINSIWRWQNSLSNIGFGSHNNPPGR
jgi:hypothetical protein